jgi:hypothetical protein
MPYKYRTRSSYGLPFTYLTVSTHTEPSKCYETPSLSLKKEFEYVFCYSLSSDKQITPSSFTIHWPAQLAVPSALLLASLPFLLMLLPAKLVMAPLTGPRAGVEVLGIADGQGQELASWLAGPRSKAPEAGPGWERVAPTDGLDVKKAGGADGTEPVVDVLGMTDRWGLNCRTGAWCT